MPKDANLCVERSVQLHQVGSVWPVLENSQCISHSVPLEPPLMGRPELARRPQAYRSIGKRMPPPVTAPAPPSRPCHSRCRWSREGRQRLRHRRDARRSSGIQSHEGSSRRLPPRLLGKYLQPSSSSRSSEPRRGRKRAAWPFYSARLGLVTIPEAGST